MDFPAFCGGTLAGRAGGGHNRRNAPPASDAVAEAACMTVDEDALAAELTGLLTSLIALPSHYPPGDTTRIAAFAAGRLEAAGYAVEQVARTPGLLNVVGRLGPRNASLVFNAHADTVGAGPAGNWATDPFRATLRDGRVYGLGAANCKGSMAVQLWLAAEIARRGGPARGEAVFTFVADEERLGPEGMYFLRESGRVRPTWLVLGAPTDNQLIVEERGVLWARIVARGRAAHAGTPWEGDNAIDRLRRVLAHVEAGLLPRLAGRVAGELRATWNLGQVHGGRNTNVVPEQAIAEIDRRLLPEEKVDDAFAEIRELALAAGEPAGSVEVERLAGTNGFAAPRDGRAAGAFAQAIERRTGRPARFLAAVGVSDGRYFADDGIEILNVGPGSGAEGHAGNESIAIADLVDAALIHLDATERLLGFRRAG